LGTQQPAKRRPNWAKLDEQYLKIVETYDKNKFNEFSDKIKLITNFKKPRHIADK
jgi:hypothetical protein